jgi:peptidylprolyl isomerase
MKSGMKTLLRTLPLALLALATPLAAQDAPLAAQDAPAAAPAPMTADQYIGNPEYMLNIDTSTGGRVVIQLYPNVAPSHVERVKSLARRGFYDGVKFHRVIEGFMAQTGDPTATGQGGSELPDLTAEFNATPHFRGTLSMARADSPDSANSQFFIMFQPRFTLDKNYTVFGRVVSGMNFVDAINRGEPPAVMSSMVQVSVAADGKPMPPASMMRDATPAGDISADDLNAPLR